MVRLRAAFEEFELAMEADGFSAKTLEWYRWLLIQSPNALVSKMENAGYIDLNDISTSELRRYIVWLREQPNSRTGEDQSEFTINAYLRAMHRFFSWCNAEYGGGNPMARIAYPKMPESTPKAVEMDDVIRMFQCCGDDERGRRNKSLLAFMLDTGARAQGICGLRMEYLDMTRRTALVREKGSRLRGVIFSTRTAELLTDWFDNRRPNEMVFYNIQMTTPLTPDGLNKILTKLGKQAGVTGRVNPHSFRHAFARGYILAGGDLVTLSRLMGHQSVSTTVNFYTIFDDDEIRQRHEQYSPVRMLK
jgi:integrase/recombinase XerD